MRDFVLSVAVAKRPKKTTVVPEGTELPMRYRGGMATVRLEELRRYGMIRIQT